MKNWESDKQTMLLRYGSSVDRNMECMWVACGLSVVQLDQEGELEPRPREAELEEG